VSVERLIVATWSSGPPASWVRSRVGHTVHRHYFIWQLASLFTQDCFPWQQTEHDSQLYQFAMKWVPHILV